MANVAHAPNDLNGVVVSNAQALDTTANTPSTDAVALSSACASLQVTINLTAIAGGSLAIAVQYSDDGTNFFAPETAQTFTALTTTGRVSKTFTAQGGRFVRLVYNLTTGPTATVTARIVAVK